MGGSISLAAVVGGRPNLMKMSPILHALDEHNLRAGNPPFQVHLIHSGLPNDARLNDTSWGDVQMPRPDVHLGVGAVASGEQAPRIMLALEKCLSQLSVDGVIVVGDGDAALAGALVAAKRNIAVFHVEAGLRSGHMGMPEEVNRVLVDAVSSILFTPSPDADANLLRHGHARSSIVCVGNVMIDNLLRHLERCRESDVLQRLGLVATVMSHGAMPVTTIPRYSVLSLRRAEALERREVIASLLQTVTGIARLAPVIAPLPVAVRKRLEEWGLDDYFIDLTARLESFGGESPDLPPGVYTVPPIAYLDFLRLLSGASLVITDSGGIQEETTGIGIPCLTVRDQTERPITVSEGTNSLVGYDSERLRREAHAALMGHGKKGRHPKLWDGQAASRIVAALARHYQGAQP